MSKKALEKLSGLYQDLGSRFERLESELERDDEALYLLKPEVSLWSVANQLHHTASATALMLAGVERLARQLPPAEEGGSLTVVGRAVLMSGRFPRGKGKAPARTVPPESFTREDLQAAVARSRNVYARIPDLLPQASESTWKVEHPYFGKLDGAQWLRLASVHADHHFEIIADIDKA